MKADRSIRPAVLATGSAVLLLLSSCAGLVGEIVAARIMDRMGRIEHFQSEVSVLGRSTSRVRLYYEKLWHIHQVVVEPDSAAGEAFVFDGRRFLFVSPRNRIALLVSGLQEPSWEEWKAFFRSGMARSRDTTTFEKEGEGTVMGRPATIYRSSPRADGGVWALPLVTRTWTDEETMFPLKVESYRPDGTLLRGFEQMHLDFDSQLPPEAFHPVIPPGTRVVEWDVASGGAGPGAAAAGLLRPEALPKDLALVADLDSAESPGAWLSFYETRPFFLLVAQWPDGALPLAFTGGCEVTIRGRPRTLLYYSGLHLVHFALDGRRVVLFSNLGLNELLGLTWPGEA